MKTKFSGGGNNENICHYSSCKFVPCIPLLDIFREYTMELLCTLHMFLKKLVAIREALP